MLYHEEHNNVKTEKDRKPHLMLRTFWQRAKTGKATHNK